MKLCALGFVMIVAALIGFSGISAFDEQYWKIAIATQQPITDQPPPLEPSRLSLSPSDPHFRRNSAEISYDVLGLARISLIIAAHSLRVARSPMFLVPKLHLGTHLLRQLHCRSSAPTERLARSKTSRGAGAFPSATWERETFLRKNSTLLLKSDTQASRTGRFRRKACAGYLLERRATRTSRIVFPLRQVLNLNSHEAG